MVLFDAPMKRVFLLVFLCLAAVAFGSTQTDLQALVNKIQEKIKSGKRAESDYAQELKAFDELVNANTRGKSEEVAQALMIKAMLYLQVLGKPEFGADVVREIQRDYPETRAGKGARKMLELIAQQTAGAKLRETLVRGAVFPDFNTQDLKGKPISISGLKGKMVLVIFWAVADGSSRIEIPSLVRTYEKYRKNGFEVVGVSLDKSKQALSGFMAEKKIKWQQCMDADNKLALQYGVNRLPTTYLLDREGKIAGVNLNWIELEDTLKQLP